MGTPFPGMDPYLEHPNLWPEVHTRLIVTLADTLGPAVRPRYRVAVEPRTYIALVNPQSYIGRPDVGLVQPQSSDAAKYEAGTATTTRPRRAQLPMPEEIRERYLEVRDVKTGELITVVEILSPTNKRPGEGRRQYEDKRVQVLGSRTHLVEIDLLRGGDPMSMHIQDNGQPTDYHYRILISRSDQRPNAEVYTFSVREPIPVFPLPLRKDDTEPALDLGEALHKVYDRAGYDLAINYNTDPVPPLEEADAAWAAQLLREAGLRSE